MKVCYDVRQNVVGNESYSPSAGKPKQVMDYWLQGEHPIEVIGFEPVTRLDLYHVHAKPYVDGVLDCTIHNGFGNLLPQVAQALPWVCGSMVAASMTAQETGEIVFSPTSGAHHACYEHGGGFCTFNFLVLAAVKLHEAGVRNVGILDCDAHFGNGCIDIIKMLGLKGIDYWHAFTGTPYDEDEWGEVFRKRVKLMVQNNDHIIYNAGADCHACDPLGGRISTETMQIRDWTVFTYARMMGLPVSVSLAGGYQDNMQDIIDLHTNTLIEAERAMVYDLGWGMNG